MLDENLIPVEDLLSIEDFSEDLGSIKDGVVALLPDLFVSDYNSDVSLYKENSYITCTLVSFKKIAFQFPGLDGFSLVLNPGINLTDSSEFPIQINFDLPILGYLEEFNLKSFDFSPRSFFDLLIRVAKIDETRLLEEVINVFFKTDYDAEDDETLDYPDPIDKFIDDYNTRFSPTTPLSLLSSTEETEDIEILEDLFSQLFETGIDFIEHIFSGYILNTDIDEMFNRVQKLFSKFLNDLSVDSFKNLITPSATVTILDINVALEFPRKLLIPIDLTTGEIITDEEIKSKLTFNVGDLSFSTRGGFEFDNVSSFSFQKSQIANTGLTLEFTDVKVDLSKESNIQEATSDGRNDDFIGAYIGSATIGLPEKWFKQKGTTLGIFGEKLLIGTGGISGTIGLKAIGGGTTDPELEFDLGSKLKMGFSKFDLVFEKGKITASDIAGSITVNLHNTPTKIGVKMHFEEDGDFSITASNKAGVNLPFGQAFSFTMRELEVGKEDSKLYLSTTGDLIFPETSPVYKILELKEPIPINKLKIWEDGHIEVDGGSIHLPKAITANLGPAKISITAIHMGSYEKGGRKYKYFGFDGGVNVNPGGVDVRGTGLKFYYTVDGGDFDSFISIDSIAIDLIIPGSATKETASVLIQGWLSVQGDEYMGGVALQLPKLNMAGNVDMRFDTKYPAWIVDAGFEFPTPIPLAATGLGIYGFRGLVGQRYVASKTAAGLTERDTWFDYYKAPVPNQGVTVQKFDKPEGTKTAKSPFSVGAGATIATLAKDGDVFSTKLFLLLSLPSVVYLEGKATILDKRLGLNDNDPPFFAVVAFEPRKSVVFNLGTQYQIGDKGRILDMYAEIGAGYYFDNKIAA